MTKSNDSYNVVFKLHKVSEYYNVNVYNIGINLFTTVCVSLIIIILLMNVVLMI